MGLVFVGILFLGTGASLLTYAYGLNPLKDNSENKSNLDLYLNQDDDSPDDGDEDGSEDDNPNNEEDDTPDESPDDEDDENSSEGTEDEIEDDNDDDGIEDEIEEENERELEVEEDEDELKIESRLKNGTNVDSIEFVIKYGEGIELKVAYESEYEDNSTEIEKELEFSIKFKEIIEFIDLDNDNVFNSSNDNEVQEYQIQNTTILNSSVKQINNNTNLYYYEIGTSDGVFTIAVYFVEEFTRIDNNLIAPSQSKIDIKINNFPYEEDNSLLALRVKLETELEYEEEEITDDEDQEYSENEKGIEITNSNYTGYFTWSEFALVEGSNVSVYSSNVEVDEQEVGEDKLYLNYPHGTEIIHDPKIGVQNALKVEPESSEISIPSFRLGWILVIGIISVIGTTYLIHKKSQ